MPGSLACLRSFMHIIARSGHFLHGLDKQHPRLPRALLTLLCGRMGSAFLGRLGVVRRRKVVQRSIQQPAESLPTRREY